MLAIEDRASKTWALLILGTQSMAKAVIFLAASWSISSLFCAGYRKLMRVPFSRNFSTSSLRGPRTLRTMSEWKTSCWPWWRYIYYYCNEVILMMEPELLQVCQKISGRLMIKVGFYKKRTCKEALLFFLFFFFNNKRMCEGAFFFL